MRLDLAAPQTLVFARGREALVDSEEETRIAHGCFGRRFPERRCEGVVLLDGSSQLARVIASERHRSERGRGLVREEEEARSGRFDLPRDQRLALRVQMARENLLLPQRVRKPEREIEQARFRESGEAISRSGAGADPRKRFHNGVRPFRRQP